MSVSCVEINIRWSQNLDRHIHERSYICYQRVELVCEVSKKRPCDAEPRVSEQMSCGGQMTDRKPDTKVSK
jgi:hypothetical protein